MNLENLVLAPLSVHMMATLLVMWKVKLLEILKLCLMVLRTFLLTMKWTGPAVVLIVFIKQQ